MKVTKLSMQLPCQYSDTELAEKRDALSDVIIAIGKAEDRKSLAARAFKEEIDGLYAQSNKLAHQIRNREESRLVECAVQYNTPQVGEKTTVRLDTGEMLKIEVMTDDERQEEMSFEVDRTVEDLLKDATPPPPPAPPEESQGEQPQA